MCHKETQWVTMSHNVLKRAKISRWYWTEQEQPEKKSWSILLQKVPYHRKSPISWKKFHIMERIPDSCLCFISKVVLYGFKLASTSSTNEFNLPEIILNIKRSFIFFIVKVSSFLIVCEIYLFLTILLSLWRSLIL